MSLLRRLLSACSFGGIWAYFVQSDWHRQPWLRRMRLNDESFFDDKKVAHGSFTSSGLFLARWDCLKIRNSYQRNRNNCAFPLFVPRDQQIEDIGSPEKVIASLGPFVTGNTFNLVNSLKLLLRSMVIKRIRSVFLRLLML